MNLKNELHIRLQETIQLLEKVLTTYEQNEIFLSFNGGKDCTVLLDVVTKMLANMPTNNYDLSCIYVQPAEPFQEIDEFVDQCREHYSVDIHVMKGGIKSVLEQICRENPNFKACLMGSRRTDPYCENLKPMQETDPGWPKLMRINPILDWTCADVWEYIRKK